MTYKYIAHTQPEFEHYYFYAEGFSCKVFPNLGGSIQELSCQGISLIKEISMDAVGLETYQTAYPSAILFPFPNRVSQGKYSFNEVDFQLDINEPFYNNAIHGLVSDKKFNIKHIDQQSISMRYRHDSSTGFPFPYEFQITYFFSESGIKLRFEITNVGKDSFPFGLGWHPYFELGTYGGCSVAFSAEKKYLNDPKMVPVDSEVYTEERIILAEAELDTAYKLRSGNIILNSPNYQLQMHVPEDCYVQLYTPKNRTALAIEPMTCIADAFNNGVGLKKLTPNNQFSFEISISIKSHLPS